MCSAAAPYKPDAGARQAVDDWAYEYHAEPSFENSLPKSERDVLHKVAETAAVLAVDLMRVKKRRALVWTDDDQRALLCLRQVQKIYEGRVAAIDELPSKYTAHTALWGRLFDIWLVH